METADTVIIGGGIIGCASAYYLAVRGIRSIVLERRALASEASGANAGVVGTWSAAPGKTVAHAKKSLELMAKDAEELGRPVELVRAGRVILAAGDAEWGAVQEAAAARRAEGVEIDLLPAHDLRALEPGLGDGFAGAALVRADGHVNPFLLTHAYAAGARQLGAEVRIGIEAIRLETSNGRVVGVLTQVGSIAASRVIVAAGAWSGALLAPLGISIPVRPGRGQMLVTEALPPLTPRVLSTAAVGLRQDVHGHVIIGSTVEDVGYDRGVTLPVLSQFCQIATTVLPALRDVRIIRTWAGLRPMTPDAAPILAAVPEINGLFIAAGHSRTGVTYAPVSAWLLAQMLVGDKPDLPVDPFRFERFNSVADTLAFHT